jgi:hypothetical protein
VDYGRFQIAVIELASHGARLTVANVVAHLGVEPQKAERMLDQMAREGRLDIEVDEAEGFIVYHVRGLSVRHKERKSRDIMPSRPSPLLAYREATPTALVERKSVTFAVLLGALFPGVGLAYAAPWSVVFAATLIVMVLGKIIGGILLLGPLFWLFAVGVSGVLGGLYAFRYNQEGRRAPLLESSGAHRLTG